MNTRSKVLVIGGSDSAGLAGIQRDNVVINAFGLHALNVVTANTTQNAEGLHALNPVSSEEFERQLLALLNEHVAAIKIGLLANADQVMCLARVLREFVKTFPAENFPIVLDPVFAASSGERFSDIPMPEVVKEHLLPFVSLVTPNLMEAEQLCGFPANSEDSIVNVAKSIQGLGSASVLLKGGHAQELTSEALSSIESTDYFSGVDQKFWIKSPRVNTQNIRGTGCTMASSITSALALGYSLNDAVVIGKMSINQGIKNRYGLKDQAGPVLVKKFPCEQDELPVLIDNLNTWLPDTGFPSPRLPNGEQSVLGLYPVVETADWVERLLKVGVTTLQIRNKSLIGSALSDEIFTAVKIAKQYNARLFVNDYWQLAIEHGAYGVHLGQEDLQDADLEKIFNAGLRLGISTHCHYEVARAHALKPSYIACGPVFPTTSKDMPWVPHGISGLNYWREVLRYPLVAIGGIDEERFSTVVDTGVESVAMISAITHAENPEAQTIKFIEMFNG